MKTILFHGPSGSGKDTQVELLEEKFESDKADQNTKFMTNLYNIERE